MTCEVLVGNGCGIALAADSAITLTVPGTGRSYCSGANKIFQFSNDDPVGIMIYNAASLHDMPWEVIIKAFREDLQGKKFATLKEYRENFIEYLNFGNTILLSESLRRHGSFNAFRTAALEMLRIATKGYPLPRGAQPPKENISVWLQNLTASFNQSKAYSVHPSLLETERDQYLSEATELIAKDLQSVITSDLPFLGGVNATEWAAAAIRFAFATPSKLANLLTGIVIAGYGNNEYLPGYCHFSLHGFIGTRIAWTPINSEQVTIGRRPSLINAFARRAMVETFIQGASAEAWRAGRDAFSRWAKETVQRVAEQTNNSIDNKLVDRVISSTALQFDRQWRHQTFNAHLSPLKNVVATLTLEELAELAENLVMLESLKEKVTSRTQSVGGPVDLAVITKSEGLVWIKRKHYFDPALNHRYFLRLGRTGANNEQQPD